MDSGLVKLFKDQINGCTKYQEVTDINFELNDKFKELVEKLHDRENYNRLDIQKQIADTKVLIQMCKDKCHMLKSSTIRENQNFRNLAKKVLNNSDYKTISKAAKMQYAEGKRFIEDKLGN